MINVLINKKLKNIKILYFGFIYSLSLMVEQHSSKVLTLVRIQKRMLKFLLLKPFF